MQMSLQNLLGRTGLVKHSTDTGDSPSVRQPHRRMPPFQREQACQMTVLFKPTVVIAPKKDGSLHFCMDFCKLNLVTCKDAYPLPRIDDSLEALSGSWWFSTLNLLCGFWQVETDKKDRQKTGFCTQDRLGLFKFKVMPFGLCNAPAMFQRLMDLVLEGIQWKSCLVYIDDIVIVGKSFEQHLQKLELVLERLKQARPVASSLKVVL